MHCPLTHTSPELQQVQPHLTASGSHVIGRHWPLLQSWPQPHAGEQVLPVQMPFLHVLPLAQPHGSPQPSSAPQVPSVGHFGLQQAFWYATSPLGHGQVLPHPFDMPSRLWSLGQFGAQQAPL
jgi:hypothetical protein